MQTIGRGYLRCVPGSEGCTPASVRHSCFAGACRAAGAWSRCRCLGRTPAQSSSSRRSRRPHGARRRCSSASLRGGRQLGRRRRGNQIVSLSFECSLALSAESARACQRSTRRSCSGQPSCSKRLGIVKRVIKRSPARRDRGSNYASHGTVAWSGDGLQVAPASERVGATSAAWTAS